ncbi:MAG: UDP-N-acetylmuramate--L-alanine ligase [Chitinophagaceae bacterium]
MKSLQDIHRVYFIGIGGIGMSALASFFYQQGIEVFGYDKTCSHLTHNLQKQGIDIHYEDDVSRIPKNIDLIIYTPAIKAPETNILAYCIDQKMDILKRSQILRLITENMQTACISGTHGKTTISTMTAHVLRDTGFGCNAFLGGVSVNYNINFWSDKNKFSVIEADEYDRSFLQLFPTIATISAMDADHLDIYHTVQEMQNAYIQFTHQIQSNGLLIYKYGLLRKEEFGGDRKLTYHLVDKQADIFAKNILIKNNTYYYDVQIKGKIIKKFELHVHGKYNIENSLVAIAIAYELGIEEEKIKKAIATFKGVKRRFEYYMNSKNQILIDDYAHHPKEIEAFIKGLHDFYPEKKELLVFQPHLYTRTRDFSTEFSSVLDQAYEVILLPIYPARELPIGGINSEMIMQKMKHKRVQILSKEMFLEYVKNYKHKVIGMVGAGDIELLLEPVKKILLKKQ